MGINGAARGVPVARRALVAALVGAVAGLRPHDVTLAWRNTSHVYFKLAPDDPTRPLDPNAILQTLEGERFLAALRKALHADTVTLQTLLGHSVAFSAGVPPLPQPPPPPPSRMPPPLLPPRQLDLELDPKLNAATVSPSPAPSSASPQPPPTPRAATPVHPRPLPPPSPRFPSLSTSASPPPTPPAPPLAFHQHVWLSEALHLPSLWEEVEPAGDALIFTVHIHPLSAGEQARVWESTHTSTPAVSKRGQPAVEERRILHRVRMIQSLVLSAAVRLKQEQLRVGWISGASFVLIVDRGGEATLPADARVELARTVEERLGVLLRAAIRVSTGWLPSGAPLRLQPRLPPLRRTKPPTAPPEKRSVCPSWALRFGTAGGAFTPAVEYRLRITVPPAQRAAGRYTLSALAKRSDDYASAGRHHHGKPGQLLFARFWSSAGCSGAELALTTGGWPSAPDEWQRLKASYHPMGAALAPGCVEWHVGFPSRTTRGSVWITQLQLHSPDGSELLADGDFPGGVGMAAHETSPLMHTSAVAAGWGGVIEQTQVQGVECGPT